MLGDEKRSADCAADFRSQIAMRREAVKNARHERQAAERAADESGVVGIERWSGLKIQGRCVPKEKWEAAMVGKQLVSIADVSGLRSAGADKVVIGVLCSKPGEANATLGSRELFAQWCLTDLDKSGPQKAMLSLTGAAFDHWCSGEGAGFCQAKVGAIFAVLNPTPSAKGTMRVSYESQVIKLGTCPNFGSCSAKLSTGLECGAPFEVDKTDYCARHAQMSAWARCHEVKGSRSNASLRARQRGSGRTGSLLPSRVASSSSARSVGMHCKNLAVTVGEAAAAASARLPEQASIALELVLFSADGSVPVSTEKLLQSLKELARLDDHHSQPLAKGDAYDALAGIARRPDATAAVASQLRRRWRLLAADGGASCTSTANEVLSSAMPVSKRAKRE